MQGKTMEELQAEQEAMFAQVPWAVVVVVSLFSAN
jgi:hypothetical protein